MNPYDEDSKEVRKKAFSDVREILVEKCTKLYFEHKDKEAAILREAIDSINIIEDCDS